MFPGSCWCAKGCPSPTSGLVTASATPCNGKKRGENNLWRTMDERWLKCPLSLFAYPPNFLFYSKSLPLPIQRKERERGAGKVADRGEQTMVGAFCKSALSGNNISWIGLQSPSLIPEGLCYGRINNEQIYFLLRLSVDPMHTNCKIGDSGWTSGRNSWC